ncbi:helix-turn-helix domain-containing protein [Pusillimonas sp.]|uniref:helix-turn-helix domain-containing protein n=1 Tax=Pusillimonas sp. TaxID=3040095 RepID=UPI0037CC298C
MEGSFVIVSKVPERISRCTVNLQSLTTNFLFFSDLASLLAPQLKFSPRLIVIDNADGELDIAKSVRQLKSIEIYGKTIILVIVDEGSGESGITALEAGANDYLIYPFLGRELEARVRIHLNSAAYEEREPEYDLEGIYPVEDRVILKNALWHLEKHTASIASLSDLSLLVGRGQKDIDRAFRTHFKKTASAYTRAFKIDKAKDLLSKTRLPVTQIAHDVGYSSAANFSTAFKSAVGLTPVQYRAQSPSLRASRSVNSVTLNFD